MEDRPSFHEYFLMLSFVVSLRSDDLFIKHGAVIVSKSSKHIIGTGYNATMRGSRKDVINPTNREKRRPWMIHAEENAILNCTKNPLDLPEGAILYVTGLPCVNCLQRVVNFGIKEIWAARRDGTCKENEETHLMRKDILEMSGASFNEIDLNNKWLKKVCSDLIAT